VSEKGTTMAGTDYVFDVSAGGFARAVSRSLDERGFAVLRGLFTPETVAEVMGSVRRFSQNPALAGVPGYCKVDHPKRLISPYSVGGAAVDMILDERVIDLIEDHMKSECVLAEANVKIDEGVGYVYFPMHADFSIGWRKGTNSDFELTREQLEQPIGIGGAIYLEDTTEGAFCYCEGTHKMLAPRGPNIDTYPADERRAVLGKMVRIDGKAGDFVIFDDRGFHGPDQPSRARRTVILVDYYRVDTFGHTLVSPVAVWSSDIGRLSKKQLRVLGVGAGAMVEPDAYMSTRFRRNPVYGVARLLVQNAYLWPHFKNKLRSKLTRRGHRQ